MQICPNFHVLKNFDPDAWVFMLAAQPRSPTPTTARVRRGSAVSTRRAQRAPERSGDEDLSRPGSRCSVGQGHFPPPVPLQEAERAVRGGRGYVRAVSLQNELFKLFRSVPFISTPFALRVRDPLRLGPPRGSPTSLRLTDLAHMQLPRRGLLTSLIWV